MIPILDAAEMRAADRAAIEAGVPSERLMENAAAALAEELVVAFPAARRVLAACGPGSNGGDGLAAARILSGRGLSVSVFTLADPSSYRGDAGENAARARAVGLALLPISGSRGRAAFRRALADADVVVDALFGTGLSRPLTGAAARAVSDINRSGRPVVAADLPSGLSADTGDVPGPSVLADVTVAFGAPKRGHVFFPARERCGRVVVRDIGISRDRLLEARRERRERIHMPEPDDLRALLPARPADSHKADFGRVAVIAGSRGKAGAAVLTARGALRAGAGLVTVFCPASLEALVVAALPEAMSRGLPERDGALAEEGGRELLRALEEFDAAVAGPGLGTAPGTVALLERLLGARVPLVCDADALNAFAGRPSAFALAKRRGRTILTPHPGEAGRLLKLSGRKIQGDRLAAARRLAEESRSVVILKGAASLVADPSGDLAVNPTGTPLMATAGSGDVLAGAVGALLAGGLKAKDAAIAGAWLHGAAGEILARALGDAGLLASELADALPLARNALRTEGGRREAGGG